MPINQRIKILIDELDMNPNSFGHAIGVPVPTMRRVYNDKNIPGADIVEKILDTFPSISAEWLLRGKGEHVINDASITNESATTISNDFGMKSDKRQEDQTIPLYNITAAAGLVSLFNSSKNIIDYIKIPNLPKCDGAIHVAGDSMYPLLKNGDIVAFKQVADREGMFFGEMYVLDVLFPGDPDPITTVKFVQKSEKGEEYIKLVSQNQYHAEKEIHWNQVKAIGLVKASIRINSIS
ncbi:S24 family peptidase [Rufibacter soli]